MLDAPQRFEQVSPEQAAVINANVPISRLPNPAAGPFTMAGASAADQANALTCLAMAVYYEAATQPPDGQAAVAQVVLNRVRNAHYPKSVCGVVFQGSELPTGCQFTFTCDGSLKRSPNPTLWRRAQEVAQRALGGYVQSTVGLATHYHTVWVVPYWQSTVLKVGQIGAHVFYRMEGGLGVPAAFSGRYSGAESIPGFEKLGFNLAVAPSASQQIYVANPDKAVDTTLPLAPAVHAAEVVQQAKIEKPQDLPAPAELSSRIEFFGGHEASASQRLPIAGH